MKLYTFFVCGSLLMGAGSGVVAALPMHRSTQAKALPEGPRIKVLLEKDAQGVFLEAKGQFRVVRKDTNAVLSSGSVGKRFVAHAIQDGLRWGEEYPDVYQISVIPLNRDTTISVNGIQYHGIVSVYRVRDNRIAVVNEIAIEEYLKCTLAIQYKDPLPQEAMAALAIAARTEAFSRVVQGQQLTRPWDVTAQEESYFGFGVTQQKSGIEEAVDLTRFMVLESLQGNGPAQNVTLAASKADELASKGWDAQKILKTAFPQTKMGIMVDLKALANR